MRLGLILTERREADMARLAESHGLFGVLAGTGEPRTAITAAVYASTATDFVRVVVNVRLGREHPVTIAEELSVLDNVNNGRTVVLADTAELTPGDAADELAVIREALGNRPISHEGPRWKVPAGLAANATAPPSIAVTPKPAQLENRIALLKTLSLANELVLIPIQQRLISRGDVFFARGYLAGGLATPRLPCFRIAKT